jgi:hypothetical protein
MLIKLARVNIRFLASGSRIAIIQAARTRFPSRAWSNKRNFHAWLRRPGRALRKSGRCETQHSGEHSTYDSKISHFPHRPPQLLWKTLPAPAFSYALESKLRQLKDVLCQDLPGI